MSRFTDKFFSTVCYVDGAKMHEVSNIIRSRDESLSFSFPDFIVLLGDKLVELDEAVIACNDENHLNRKKLLEEIEYEHIKISMMICMLSEYFYPILEYIQKISSDGITNQSESKKLRSK